MSDTKTITVPETAGWCAWDADECWVKIALDTPEQMDALLEQLGPRNRVRVIPEEDHFQAMRTA